MLGVCLIQFIFTYLHMLSCSVFVVWFLCFIHSSPFSFCSWQSPWDRQIFSGCLRVGWIGSTHNPGSRSVLWVSFLFWLYRLWIVGFYCRCRYRQDDQSFGFCRVSIVPSWSGRRLLFLPWLISGGRTALLNHHSLCQIWKRMFLGWMHSRWACRDM